MEGYHKPVLLREAIDALSVRDAWYIDCTLGDGGHCIELIARGGRVVGLDIDPQALKRVQKRFKDLGIDESKYKLIQGNFRELKDLLNKQTDPSISLRADQKFAGAIFDLGVSSLQLMSPERGFSFAKNGPLDMRMDPGLGVRALDLIKILTRKELYELFSNFGEEKYSWQVASALVSSRGVRTTKELAGLVEGVYRRVGTRNWEIHPATRVFQALRIAVNDELGALETGLEEVKDLIEKNGHIVIISFHSLEDRIVKDTFARWQDQGWGQVLTKKPILPNAQEINENPRARSAKMRVFRL
ncbi:MAG: Ribosomal RNA small subunit methyltransferase H [Microgenomates group bacterium Gr01-1014_7]|nr:MAG: Ribosomal RNA small subunit methyltransferase H [Microgenomates group bacterium Gr01-1014_7]